MATCIPFSAETEAPNFAWHPHLLSLSFIVSGKYGPLETIDESLETEKKQSSTARGKWETNLDAILHW